MGCWEQSQEVRLRDFKANAFLKDILIQGGLIAVCTMAAYYVGLTGRWSGKWGQNSGIAGNSAAAATMAFTTLTLARLFHGFNCRSHHSMFYLGLFTNLYSIMAFEAGAVASGRCSLCSVPSEAVCGFRFKHGTDWGCSRIFSDSDDFYPGMESRQRMAEIWLKSWMEC